MEMSQPHNQHAEEYEQAIHAQARAECRCLCARDFFEFGAVQIETVLACRRLLALAEEKAAEIRQIDRARLRFHLRAEGAAVHCFYN